MDHRLGPDSGVRGRRGRRRQGLVELSRHGVRLRRWHNATRRHRSRLGRAAHHRLRHHDPGMGHQVVGGGEPGHHRHQGRGRAARGDRRGVLHQVLQLHAVHSARGVRRRLGHRTIAAVAHHRRRGQQLRLVRASGWRVDRVLRVHRLRHRRHHRRGDQGPAARHPPRHSRLAGDRHRALCRGRRRADRHGELHGARRARRPTSRRRSPRTGWSGRPR